MSEAPPLDGDYLVPSDAAEQLRRDGHTVLRGLCSAEEIEAYRPVIHEAALRLNRETRPLQERDTYGKAFLQITNLWRKDEEVARFVLARRFAKAAADLLGVDGVRLYHDQALFKEAGGGHTPWHQDQFYWPLDTDATVTMWMPLVDVPPEVGSMTFATGSHTADIASFVIADASDDAVEKIVAEHGFPRDTHGALAAGDATFHVGKVLHAAPANPTGMMRAVMTVIYFADGTRVAEPANDYQEFDRKKWLRPREPGETADGELNPLLYSAR